MTDPTSPPAAGYGAYSEAGQLRKVLVCAPGLPNTLFTGTPPAGSTAG